jgi:hypothetical protein
MSRMRQVWIGIAERVDLIKTRKGRLDQNKTATLVHQVVPPNRVAINNLLN